MLHCEFLLNDFIIDNTRSRHTDTDFVSASVAVGNKPPQKATRAMGDLNNGEYPVGLKFDVDLNEGEVVVFSYAIVNSGHSDPSFVEKQLEQAVSTLATKGAQAAASAAGTALGTLIGAELGTDVVPIIGTALGALAGWLVSTVGSALFADCDGPVAAALHAYTYDELRAELNDTQPKAFAEAHNGQDSPHGCGSNSQYTVKFTIATQRTGGGTYDGVWDPATHGQYIDFGIPAAQVSQQYKTRWEANYRLTCIQPYVQGGAVFYDLVYDPGTYNQAVIWDADEANAIKSYDAMQAKGLRMLQVRPFVHNAQLRLCFILNAGTTPQFVSYDKPSNVLTQQIAELAQKSLFPSDISACQFGADVLYSVVFDAVPNAGYLMGYSLPDLEKVYADKYQNGVRLSRLSSFTINGAPRFNAIFKQTAAGQFVSWAKAQAELRTQYSDMWNKGYRIVSLDSF